MHHCEGDQTSKNVSSQVDDGTEKFMHEKSVEVTCSYHRWPLHQPDVWAALANHIDPQATSQSTISWIASWKWLLINKQYHYTL